MENPSQIQFSSKWLPYMHVQNIETSLSYAGRDILKNERFTVTKTFSINTRNAEFNIMVRTNMRDSAYPSSAWVSAPVGVTNIHQTGVMHTGYAYVLGSSIIVVLEVYNPNNVTVILEPTTFDFKIQVYTPPIQDE